MYSFYYMLLSKHNKTVILKGQLFINTQLCCFFHRFNSCDIK